jgi:hypothetical protein
MRSPSSTLEFKISVIDTILKHFYAIRHIDLYDDRLRHVKLFEEHFQARKDSGQLVSFSTFHVKSENAADLKIPIDLEKQLVGDLVEICNNRIRRWQSKTKLKGLRGSIETEDSNGEISEIEGQKVCRRLSISQFRSIIQLVPCVEYTAVFLDDVSVAKLKSAFRCPHGWLEKSDHVTVSLGTASAELEEAMGGFGSKHTFYATHYGEIEGKVQAVKVEGPSIVSWNATIHITLYVSDSGSSKLSNSITNWEALPEPILLHGVYDQKVAIGSSTEKLPPEKKKDVSIGNLVKTRFPTLDGPQIGVLVRHVQDWMDKTFIENANNNRALIEYYIQTVDAEQILNKPNE